MDISIIRNVTALTKFDGGKWYTEETFDKAVKEYFDRNSIRFVTKGISTDMDDEGSISICNSDIIGSVVSITKDSIIMTPVDVDDNSPLKAIIKMAEHNLLIAKTRMIILQCNPETNEILDMRIICFELSV